MIAAGVSTPFQMPVYAMGVTEHETPFSFGSSLPPLTFTWAVNSREVLHLESVYHGVSSCLTFLFLLLLLSAVCSSFLCFSLQGAAASSCSLFPSSSTHCSVQLLPLVPFLCYSLQCAAPSCSLPLLVTAVCSSFLLFPSSASHSSVQFLPLVPFLC